ncbi:Y-box-binding protein 1-like [Hippoglossus stenolepis]|uniref:Y-box-binding protein 1-like n=1 Tax=Hippoglossus stenolepis TaxID=195615 RepID=UPI001FAFC587|nr:Y-box-binding protein 1-like [Hippoglossus stenolepis]
MAAPSFKFQPVHAALPCCAPQTDPTYSHHPVQPLPQGGYQSYNPPYNNDQGGEDEEEEEGEEEEEQDPYYHRVYPPQYYPQPPPPSVHDRRGYPSSPAHSEDVELRSPGVVRRFSRDVVVMEESEEGGL